MGTVTRTGYFDEIQKVQDGRAALEYAKRSSPALILMDIEIPYPSGLQVAQSIIRRDPTVKIILVTARVDEHTLCEAHRLVGLAGFLLKADGLLEDIHRIIPLVLQGTMCFCKAYTDLLLNYLRSHNCLEKILNRKDIRFLCLVGAGKSDEEIAEILDVPLGTVQSRIKKLRRILLIHSRAELIIFAQQKGCGRVSWRGMGLIDRYGLKDD